jgi:hypothetical protein
MPGELKRRLKRKFKTDAHGLEINNLGGRPACHNDRPIDLFHPFSIPTLIAIPAAARDTLERAEGGSIAVACPLRPM